MFEKIAGIFYRSVRPLITRGDIQNAASVKDPDVVHKAIFFEETKDSQKGILRHFYAAVEELMIVAEQRGRIGRVIDIGTATGRTVSLLAQPRPGVSFEALDIMAEALGIARERYAALQNLSFRCCDFLNGPVRTDYDLALCLQTLEHVEDHLLSQFIGKLFSVARRGIIVSVPREPFWCLANMTRLKCWSRLGNSPHHLQHWTRRGIEQVLLIAARKAWGSRVAMVVRSPLSLWTVVLLLNDNVQKEGLV